MVFCSQTHWVSILSSRLTSCPTWFIPRTLSNGTTTCKCGSNIHGLVKCDNVRNRTLIFNFYCMTYNQDRDRTVFGACQGTCYTLGTTHRYNLPKNISKLNKHICHHLNRDGQFCGKCIKDFAPPVYSYHYKCADYSFLYRCTD